jgi:hypothetical protein
MAQGPCGWQMVRGFAVLRQCSRGPVALGLLTSGFLLGAILPHAVLAQGRDVTLPVDLSGARGEIAVEIDGTDLTEFVRIEGDRLIVSASAALAPGPHEAKVYVLAGDGYQLFATYSFDVAETADPSVSVELSAEHEAGVTATNGDVEGHVASTGTVKVETVDQSMTARLSYAIASRDDEKIGGRFANIAEYAIELHQSGPLLDLTGRIGHQSLGFDRALVADLNRRGLSVEGTGPGERLQFHLFALKSSNAEGAENLLGLAAEDDRMVGGRLAFRPFTGSDLRISLQGYEGRGAPDFGAVAGVGFGHGIALDGSFADGRLRYDLSLAKVRWDLDGGGALPEDEAQALLAALAYDLEPANGAAFTLGLEYERVGLYYFSLANPGLPTGGETVRLTADYAAERLTLSGTVETTLTNEDGDPLFPTDRVNKLALDGSWALYDAGFLSDATLTFGISDETIRRVETPLGAPGPENWSGTTAYLGVEKYGDTAGWSLVYTYLNEVDDGGGNFDLTGHEISTTLDLAPSDRFTLAATALVGSYDSTFSGTYERLDADIGIDYALDPGVWALSLDLGISATTEIGIDDGAYAAALLTRNLPNGAELVLNAGWYDGTYAETTGVTEDTIFGLTYRVRSDSFR